jgi:hypothetical protein
MGYFSGLYILGLKVLVYIVRRAQFRIQWQGKYREFMVQRPPFAVKQAASPAGSPLFK